MSTLRSRITAAALLASLLASTTVVASDLSRVIDGLHLDTLHQAAPNLTFTNVQGKKSELAEYRGKAILLHLWASWCKPCQKELPDLEKLAGRLDPNHWAFLPISVDEPEQRQKAIDFLKQSQAQIPFLQLKPSEASEKYKTWGLPVTYLIDPSGQLVARALGPRDWAGKPETAVQLNAAFSSSRSATQNK